MFESLSENGDYGTLKLSISGSTMIWSDPEGEGESMIFTLIDEV